MTNNCEIVDNVACGQAFKYCRTHKVESKDCPGNAKPTEPQLQAAGLAAYQTYINYVADVVATKREFKVGDKVRCIKLDQYDWESENWTILSGLKIGDVRTVSTVESSQHISLRGVMFTLDNRNFEVVECA